MVLPTNYLDTLSQSLSAALTDSRLTRLKELAGYARRHPSPLKGFPVGTLVQTLQRFLALPNEQAPETQPNTPAVRNQAIKLVAELCGHGVLNNTQTQTLFATHAPLEKDPTVLVSIVKNLFCCTAKSNPSQCQQAEALLKHLSQPTQPAEARRAVASHAGSILPEDQAQGILEPLLTDPDIRTQNAARMALGHPAPPRYFPKKKPS